MHSDPIADMATRMRNALSADHASVKIPHSQLKEAIAQLLKKESFIHDYHLEKDGKFEVLSIDFQKNDKKKMSSITRVSKPGQRMYLKSGQIKSVRSGMGILVVSTSQGVIAGYDAYKKGIGGEVLLEVY
jgi:small subunit ribosomal protein S8